MTKAPGIAGIPPNLDGVPVIVKVTGEIRALSNTKDRFNRPVPTGVSTGHPDITAGTIACRVTDGTNVYALSNNHVYANQNEASIGDAVIQPGTFDGGSSPADDIGTLSDFEPIVFKRKAKNEIDAAIALSSTGDLGTATPSNGYGTPNSAIVGAVLGQQVQKFGRTTELTKGEITGVNATVNVGYGSGKTAKFVKQIIIEPGGFSAGGDSGSLIVTDDGNRNPVGLLFAGSSTLTVANRIDLVLDRFNVTVDGEAPPAPGPTGSRGGTVTNASTGVTIVGATVTDGTRSATTDSSGDYTIADVPEGTYIVTASATGYNSVSQTGVVVTAEQLTSVDFALTATEPPASLSITVNTDKDIYKLKDTVKISGRVTDGAGVAGATVTLVIDPPKGPNLTPVDSPVTDGNGDYSFNFKTGKRTGTGTYTVTVTAEKSGVQSNTASTTFEVTK